MYRNSCENLLKILAVVIIWSPISSVCGVGLFCCGIVLSCRAYSRKYPKKNDYTYMLAAASTCGIGFFCGGVGLFCRGIRLAYRALLQKYQKFYD